MSPILRQAAEDAVAGAAGAARALPYAVALAAALSTESPFVLVDSIMARPRINMMQVCVEASQWVSCGGCHLPRRVHAQPGGHLRAQAQTAGTQVAH